VKDAARPAAILDMIGGVAERSSFWGAVRPRLRRLWYLFFRQRPYYYAGALFWAAMSLSERERFRTARFRRGTSLGWRENCLRAYADARYYARFASSPTLTPENQERWSGPTALEYHEGMRQYYSERPEEFEIQHEHLLAQLTELFAAEDYQYVVEIGCGNGLLLERVATLAPRSIPVGLDMNPDIIALNRERYPQSRAQYCEGTTVQEFLQRVGPESALVYGSGTFTFFTPNEFVECLRWLQENVPRGAVVAADSTFLQPDLERTSQPADGHGFRHNYEQLLREAGLENLRSRLQPFPDYGASRIVASGTWSRRGTRSRPSREAEPRAERAWPRD